MAAPWFKFWADDYLMDEGVDRLPLEAQGILVRLWCLCQKLGSITWEPASLARRAGIDPKAMAKHAQALRPFFCEDEDGRLYSKRLRQEATAYDEKAKKLRENGTKGGRPRKPKQEPDENQMVSDLVSKSLADGNQTQTEERREKRDSSSLRSEELPPYAPQGAPAAAPPLPEVAPAEPVVKKPKRTKAFAIAALSASVVETSEADRVWAKWPPKGWNYATRTSSPRRLNYNQFMERFVAVVRNCPERKADGSLLTAEDHAEAAIAWVEARIREANGGVPNVPCIANYFSSEPGQKHPWKEGLLAFFQAIPEAS